MKKGRVLVVDDDAFHRTLCTDVLKSGGFYVKAAASGEEAIGIIEKEPIDIVITDLVMPGMNGLEVLERTKQFNTLIDVIVVTGHGSLETAISALKHGAFDYLGKPFNEDELLHTVTASMEKKKLLEENSEMRQSLKLFEVSRTITTTLEINKLYNITIDAFLQMLPAEAGILAFYENEGKDLELKAVRHLGIEAGEKVIGAFKESLSSAAKIGGRINVIPASRFTSGVTDPEVARLRGSVILSTFFSGDKPIGYLLVFTKLSREAISDRDLRNADFVADHASQAFENARKYVEAKEMAFIDSLTNLYNGKYLETALERELRRADRLMMPVTVLFLDLDNFKLINDRNDHLVGSKVLVEVGKILLKCVREVDTVIRYGGDEFVVILVDAGTDAAFKVADRIRQTIERTSFLAEEGLDLRVTASIGVATYPVHAREKKELVKLADKAMYSAKGISKNLVYLAPVEDRAI